MTIDASNPFKGRLDTIATADIETASDGRLLDVNLAFENEYFTFDNWTDWLLCASRVCKDHRIGRIWFHNGGRFDLVGLVKQCLDGSLSHIIEKFDATLISGAIIQVKIRTHGSKRTIKLADSFRLMPASLEALAKGFNIGKGKDDVPERYKSCMETFKRDYPDRYRAYHHRDTALLLDILVRYRSILNELSPIGNLRLTCGATAMAAFRTSFLASKITTPGRAERDYTRMAYQGGRCEYIGDGDRDPGKRATFSGVKKYDINSQYPREMHDGTFPVAPGIFTTRQANMRDNQGRIRPGVYRVRYRQASGRIALLKPRVSGGGVASDASWSGETYATYLELREIEYGRGRVELIDGYVYRDDDMKPLFRQFVAALYGRRLIAERDGNDALKYVIKLILNNLYGKFGQGETGEKLVTLEIEEAEKLLSDGEVVLTPLPDLGDTAYAVREEIHVDHAFPAIAAFITAAARLALLRPINSGRVRAIYCDTDSIHTQDTLPPEMVDAKRLGAFKLETGPEGVTMAYGGRKIYVEVGTKHSRLKGIPSRVHDVPAIHAAIEASAVWSGSYASPSSIKTAIKRGHEHPNMFRPYERRMTPEESSREKGQLR